MRLTDQEIKAIKDTVYHYDKQATVYLFGSRVDDNKRGGDIDLAIQSKAIAWRDITGIQLKLYDLIGEQKIDIVIDRGQDDPFVKMAVNNGIAL